MSMEEDLEAGLGVISGVGNLSGGFVVRFGQEKVGNLENSEHVVRFQIGMKPAKDEIKSKRPPRPPKGPALDAYDLKLIKELSQLALERRMRIRDLKKKRASTSSSNSSFISLMVTAIFCLIILFQGVYSRSGSVVKSQTSSGPVLSPTGEELLSLQVLKNHSPTHYGNGDSSEALKSLTPVLKEGPTQAAVM